MGSWPERSVGHIEEGRTDKIGTVLDVSSGFNEPKQFVSENVSYRSVVPIRNITGEQLLNREDARAKIHGFTKWTRRGQSH